MMETPGYRYIPSDAAKTAMSSQISWCTVPSRMMPRLECFRGARTAVYQCQEMHRRRRQRQRHGSTAFSE